MDILQWITGKKCLKLNSFGSLSYFKKENAPEGSPVRVPVMIIEPKDPSICNSASLIEELIGKGNNI